MKSQDDNTQVESVTRQQLASKISDASELTIKSSNDVLDLLIEEISTSLSNGVDVLISGFGKFVVQSKAERIGRNPRTGSPVTVSARKVMRFKPSGLLKSQLNKRFA